MKIGIIGAGNIGSTLATHFNRLDHEVWIANSRGPSTLSDLERRTGARGATVEDALAGAGLVVVTIPMKNVKELPKAAFALVPDSTIVVDTCNYYPDTRDGTIPELEGKIAESAYVETQIGHPVIKAFNNIMAPLLAKLGRPRGEAGRIALPVAGDEPRQRRFVMNLIEAMGFDPVNAGGIAESWRQQQGTPVYCTNLDVDGVRNALRRADHRRLVEMRKKNEALMKGLFKTAEPEAVVAAVRELHRVEDARKAG